MSSPEIVKVWEEEDWKVEVERCEGFYFLHCYIHSKPKSSIQQVKRLCEEEIEPYGHSLGLEEFFVYTENKRFMDFLEMFKHIFTEPNTKMEIYEWDLSSAR